MGDGLQERGLAMRGSGEFCPHYQVSIQEHPIEADIHSYVKQEAKDARITSNPNRRVSSIFRWGICSGFG